MSIIQMRGSDVLLKTHKTMYIDQGGFVFSRTAPQCNFILTLSKLQNVPNIQCELPGGRLQGNKMRDVYDARDLDCITFLCGILNVQTPGGCKRQLGGTFMHSDEVIYNKLIAPLIQHRPDVEDIRLFHQDRSNKIVVLIDFVEDRRSILLLKWPLENDDAIQKAIVGLGPKETFI